MRVSRIYVTTPLSSGTRIELNEDTAHYVRTVLRLKPEQSIILFNGQGGEYAGKLAEVSRKCVCVQVENFIARQVESPLDVRLGIGISRGDRMDWAVQKAVELGVSQITPLITERCQIKFNGDDKKQQRLQHWQHIVQHAAEQSGRTQLPTLGEISHLPDWAAQQSALKLFLDPYAQQTLQDLQPETPQLSLLSGPEGGFSDTERQTAIACGFIPVRLGPRILRTETAVLAALSTVQILWGDFKS